MGKRSGQQAVSDMAGTPLNVAVCVPSHGTWKPAFGQALCNMLACFSEAQYDGPKQVQVIGVGGSMLPEVRQRCVAEAVKAKWKQGETTHVLFLDSDMIFPRDTLQVLLRHNLPIVGVNYVRRHFPATPTAWKDDKALETLPKDKGVIEVDHVGMGVMLVDRRVFDCIELPFFSFDYKDDGLTLVGEDVYFCRQCKKAGIPTYIDHDLSKMTGHMGELAYRHGMALQE